MSDDQNDARRDWYRAAIDSDPERRARFAVALERFDSTPGKSDDLPDE